MPSIFPYGIALREGGTIEVFPAVEIFLPSKDNEQLALIFVIDSGATISALPKSDAPLLGIIPEKGVHLLITGIGKDPIQGWKHMIRGHIGKEDIIFPLVFLENETAPRVLGREGIFNNFTLIFEEHKKRSGFFLKDSKESKIISKFIDKI